MNPQEVLARQIAYVRELYCMARRRHEAKRGKTSDFGEKELPQWDGGEHDGREYQPYWPKIVAFCKQHQLDPARLVRAIFDSNESPTPPTPKTLVGVNALALYKKHEISERLILQQELNYYRNQAHKYFVSFTVRKDLEPDMAWREVVMEDPPMLSALFRYCLAVKAGFDDLAADHADTAMQEYFWAKEIYDAEWGDWIPPGLKEQAEARQAALQQALSGQESNDE